MLLALNPPLPVLAVNTYDVSAGNITIVGNDSSYTVNGVQTSGPIVIIGTSTQYKVTLDASNGGTLNVTFQGLDIDVRSVYPRAAAVTTTGNVTIELDGTNTLKSNGYHAGLEKSDTAGLLTIKDVDGGGTLNATGGDRGAGIGGGDNVDGSHITIISGTVNATGGRSAAGIGGGYSGNGSNITISGGTVNATGGRSAAGIGGGYLRNGSDITISGGTVSATGRTNAAGIGGGESGDGSDITIEGGNVTAIGGDFGAGIGGGTNGDCTDIEINNGTVISVGGATAAGIGGDEGQGRIVSGITISGQAKVSVAGGSGYERWGAGAAIGKAGGSNAPGIEVPPTVNLGANGYIHTYPAGTLIETIIAEVFPQNNTGSNGGSHSGSSSSSHSNAHVHSYSWVVTLEPTAYSNGEMVYQCSCGHIKDRAEIEASSKLVTDGIRTFSAATQGATVTMDFGNYISINKAFATAHDDRPDTTTVITYNYKGEHYEMTIPAGFDLLQTINSDGWAGFKFIGSFPGVTTRQIP